MRELNRTWWMAATLAGSLFLPHAVVTAEAQSPPEAPPVVPAKRAVRSGELAAAIDAYLRPFLDGNNFTGAILVARDGTVVFNKAYGMANYELSVPNTPQTRFHVASVSKPFTAAAILLLEERGLVNTSDPVSKYIPDYPSGDKIRLEHLLAHTAGIPNVNDFPEYRRESRFYHTPADLVAMFKDKPLEFEPGSRYQYSNSNFNVLALVIEKVSGESYGQFLKTNIFDPLGLASTLHDGDAALVIKDRAYGVEPDGLRGVRNAPFIDWSAKTGNGSLVTSTGDLYRFARALFRGGFLKPGSLAKILQQRQPIWYGWTQNERGGRRPIAMAGRSPGFVAAIEYYLEDDTCVIVLSNNYSPITQDPIVGDIGALVFGEKPSAGPIAPVRPKPGELAALAGRYQMPQDYFVPGVTVTLTDRSDHLEANWGNGPRNVVYPVEGGEFLDRNFWARIRFTRGADGTVTGFVYHLIRDFVATKLAL